ncbi:hypothetical protein MAHJHV55_51520 [Mycobacterium avium subsp. hominissuis]
MPSASSRRHCSASALYSALAEQCRRLDALRIDYEIVPGVPAFAAAAAALKRELTVPGVAQTVTLSRVARSSPGGIAVDKVATRLSVTVCATPFPVLRRR